MDSWAETVESIQLWKTETDGGNLKQLYIILHDFEISTVRTRQKPKCMTNDIDKKLRNKRYKTSYAVDVSRKFLCLGKMKPPLGRLIYI